MGRGKVREKTVERGNEKGRRLGAEGKIRERRGQDGDEEKNGTGREGGYRKGNRG